MILWSVLFIYEQMFLMIMFGFIIKKITLSCQNVKKCIYLCRQNVKFGSINS